VVGAPVPLIAGIARASDGSAQFSMSNTGSLVYIPGPVEAAGAHQSIAVIGPTGDVKPLGLTTRAYANPRVSPDGRRIVFATEDGKQSSVWIYELAGGSAMRQLTLGGANRFPIWSADGTRVIFQSDREGDLALFWQRTDGTGSAERLTKPEPGVAHIADSASTDGRHVAFTAVKGFERAVWILSIPDRRAALFAGAPSAALGSSAFSRDGKWLAYHSNETKQFEVFVQPFPATGTKYQVSRDAQSHNPVWSPDGRTLFFIPGPDRFVKVGIMTQPSFSFSEAVDVPKGDFIEFGPPGPRTYDVLPDGKHLVGVVAADRAQQVVSRPNQIQVVLNWTEELKRLIPTR
jgi:serine/threonine-protein kinase